MTPAAVRLLVERRLAELRLTGLVTIGERDGHAAWILAEYEGRDAAGHSCAKRMDIPRIEGLEREDVAEQVDGRLAAQRRASGRSAGHPPVKPCPAMPLGHLVVNMPLARRLRLDHGQNAGDALRLALLALLEGQGRRLSKHPRPYGLVLDANRLDHRETLAPGVEWKGRTLVLAGMSLPQQILEGLAGRPLRSVIDHPLLEGMTACSAQAGPSSRNGASTIIETQGSWLPADRI